MGKRVAVLVAWSALLIGCEGCTDHQRAPSPQQLETHGQPPASEIMTKTSKPKETAAATAPSPTSSVETTAPSATSSPPAPTPLATPVEMPSLREVSPNEVKRGEMSSIAITGKQLYDARVYFRSDSGQEVEIAPDGITAGEEIVINDRNWNELAPGTYTIVIRTPDGRETTLPNGFTVKP